LHGSLNKKAAPDPVRPLRCLAATRVPAASGRFGWMMLAAIDRSADKLLRVIRTGCA
jgi:hypothetical protein